MYDTEKRIELVKSECMNTTAAGAAHSLPAVCSVYPVIPVSRGSNGDNAKQANKRYGNVRHNPAS